MLVVRTAPVPIQFAIHSSPALGKYTLNNSTYGTIVPTVPASTYLRYLRYRRYRRYHGTCTYGTPGVKCTRHPN